MSNGRDGKNWKTLKISWWSATFEKAITVVVAESSLRNAEARGSTLLCSTS
jgi:hypothetical protein